MKKRGAVLLIAILVSSVALAVGLGVYNRTYKELLFASFWAQTQVAFSAADAGLECALYWDLHPQASVKCFNGTPFAWAPVTGGAWSLPSDIPVSGGCVNVKITKTTVVPILTKIEARGYNTCDTTNPRRVERGLKITY